MLEGHVLNERYRINRTIGGGGMANVYLAYDTILDREVAIKVLRLEFANDPEFIERFDREAQAATSLSHPNIVNIYDVGEENHILYMVMEYVEGLTLKEYIIKHGPVAVEEAIEIMKQLTDAIQHAHVNGLIHRDIKPQNILMDASGHVKITDFGIAIALSATSLTQTNSILGSVHYLSPEQARGGMATKKSDIYSLGIVFYELLTGKLPFSGQSPISIALKHLQNDTPSVRQLNSEIPQSVENIVLQATAKDPFHRYENVYEMEAALEAALDPANADMPLFTPPTEVGEETKAIPIIINDRMDQTYDDQAETLVHQETTPTKNISKEEPTEPESEEKPKKKKRFRKTKWLIGILILLALVALIVFLIQKPDDVVIPDIEGEDYDDARETLEELGLKVNKKQTFSDEVEEDHVIKTDPGIGRTVKEHSMIDVYVSDGKETEEFGDYVGENYSQVKKVLEEEGYKEVSSYEKESDRPEGEIITQIQPIKGEEVVPSDSKVIFETSEGPKTISINQLTGLKLSEAEAFANNNDLTLKVSEKHSDEVEEGYIISQSPEADSEVEIGSELSVEVSLGPEEQPPKAHKVTFTVPFKPDENDDDDEDSEDSDDEDSKDDKDDDKEKTEQKVQIYVDDMNEDFSDVFEEDVITEDQEYELTLAIEEGKTAKYKVVRDGEVILERKVAYGEGE